MSSTKTTGGTVDSTTRPGRGKALFFIFWKSSTTLVFVRNTKRRPENPVVFLEKTTSPVHYSQGQKSSKFLWWTASWGVHRGLGVWSVKISENLHPRWFFQNGVQKIQSKNNFSSLLLLRPKIVKISLVDGLLGCSWRLRVTHPWFSLSKSSFILQFPQSPF